MTHRLFIVVIDDDPSVCKALRRLLLTAQMDVETCASGEAFLTRILPREPDCLVLDMRMPGLSGPDLLHRLQAAGRPIPVVFITAHGDEEDGLAGKTEVLRKPFDDSALLGAIHRAAGNGNPSCP